MKKIIFTFSFALFLNILGMNKNFKKHENNSVNFDVDETSYGSYFKRKNFIRSLGIDVFVDYQKVICPIKPVVNFYQLIANSNYKNIFLTSNQGPRYRSSKQNFFHERSNNSDELILLPAEILKSKLKDVRWKDTISKELNKKHNISEPINENNKDIENICYCAKLPNYLY